MGLCGCEVQPEGPYLSALDSNTAESQQIQDLEVTMMIEISKSKTKRTNPMTLCPITRQLKQHREAKDLIINWPVSVG
ncbi:UNVERIFIED_CONTAM: hypothetical protein K2H54_051768 [Gekko kuhli]